MISKPPILFALLILIVSGILFLSGISSTKKFFKYLPVPLWCYFLPTVISTLGWIPSDSALYSQMSRRLLPACLVLLLIGTDIPSIYKLSFKALAAMAVGSLGIAAGGIVSYLFLFRKVPELWKGWGCLSASWTGGWTREATGG